MNSTNFTTNTLLAGHFATNGEAHLFAFSKTAKKVAAEKKLFSVKSEEYHCNNFHSVCFQQRQLSDERQLENKNYKDLIRMSEKS